MPCLYYCFPIVFEKSLVENSRIFPIDKWIVENFLFVTIVLLFFNIDLILLLGSWSSRWHENVCCFCRQASLSEKYPDTRHATRVNFLWSGYKSLLYCQSNRFFLAVKRLASLSVITLVLGNRFVLNIAEQP